MKIIFLFYSLLHSYLLELTTIKTLTKPVNTMKTLCIFFVLITANLSAQNMFYMPNYWHIKGFGLGANIEAFDLNRDGKKDIFIGNWNNTYVYFGGKGILDSTVNVVYSGRMLAICDYNGDGYKDLITMRFTSYDSTRLDYNGEILFYFGSNNPNLAIDTIPDYSIPLPTLYPYGQRFTFGYFKFGVECGDFNKDGKSDLVINMIGAGAGYLPNDFGTIFIYMGKEVPDDEPDFIGTGSSYLKSGYGDFFAVGDINGDGYDDLLLSSLVKATHPTTRDSLHLLHIYYGNSDFRFVKDSADIVYESRVSIIDNWSEWFVRRFSLSDVNGDGIMDLVVGNYIVKPAVTNIHYGSISGIDTIPSFVFTDPDTTKPEIGSGGMSHNIGDFNNDGYDDIILTPAGWGIFSLHFCGPNVSNKNPYGLRGLEGGSPFPRKGINVGDQNDDGFSEIVVTRGIFDSLQIGNIFMFLGRNIQITSVENSEEDDDKTQGYILFQNYPNPFNSETIIKWEANKNFATLLKVVDILGREITTLIDEEMNAGKHSVIFDALKYTLASGVYFYELKLGQHIERKKMIYIK